MNKKERDMVSRFNRISVIIIFLYITVGYANSLFVILRDLQVSRNKLPAVAMNAIGEYFAIWEESTFTNEYPYYKKTKYFYQMLDAKGGIIIPKREIDHWQNSYTPYRFTGNSLMFLDSNRLLIIARRMVEPLSEPPGYRLEKLLIEFAHGTVPGDSNEANFQDCSLVRDSKGNVYAVGYDAWSGIRVMQVYPEFTQVKHTSKSNLDIFYENSTKYTEFKLRDAIMITTSNDRLLICNRMGWGYEAKTEKGAWHSFRPDRIYYTIADFNGNFMTDPIQLEINDYAFRKIPGVHLGGIYYALDDIGSIDEAGAVIQDMDLSKLPNGDIILSVTGEENEEGLCVYQIRFNSEGEVMKPSMLTVAQARSIPDDLILPVVKITYAQCVRDYIVLFGFDEEGNFYEEREVWTEREE
jgi:hypothetical protein